MDVEYDNQNREALRIHDKMRRMGGDRGQPAPHIRDGGQVEPSLFGDMGVGVEAEIRDAERGAGQAVTRSGRSCRNLTTPLLQVLSRFDTRKP